MNILKVGTRSAISSPRTDNDLKTVFRATLSQMTKMHLAVDRAATILNHQPKEVRKRSQEPRHPTESIGRPVATIEAERAATAFLDSNRDILVPARTQSPPEEPLKAHPMRPSTAQIQAVKAPAAMAQHSHSLEKSKLSNSAHAHWKGPLQPRPQSVPSSMSVERSQTPQPPSTNCAPPPQLPGNTGLPTYQARSITPHKIPPTASNATQGTPTRANLTRPTYESPSKAVKDACTKPAHQTTSTRASSALNQSSSKARVKVLNQFGPSLANPFAGVYEQMPRQQSATTTPSPQKGDREINKNDSPSERSRDERRSRVWS